MEEKDRNIENGMTEVSKYPLLSSEIIERRIYSIRNVQVMIDRDLAELYGVENRALRQAVRRNADKFPDDFLFQLTDDEANMLISIGVSQTVIPSGYNTGGARMYAFTEQGVAMLSTVLRSSNATAVSVAIMRAFVAMRRFISANAGLFQRVEAVEMHQIETDKKIEQVLDKLDELSPAPTTEQMFATGCVWDAYTFVCDLVRSAQKRIVLIDNFVDERTLMILDKRLEGVDCKVHTRYTEQVLLDFKKHNTQYAEIRYVQLPQHVHDRYLIVDDAVWLLGASVKDMGHGLCTIIQTGFSPKMMMEMMKGE